ncbi:hypothetical protein Phi13:2_gp041 [Cellulophaga phage phi13:2]|uniref:Uncharacterized protein n=1 Tax=Cellulophaga phage phi13:2 TaxID=1328030 RepID=S0A2M4_9CAUD|nr:hypothetical protein Phi13:2_gp041 [Cellulophaga phage phi13:2]AGO49651.1 hypothetical protein Phi13:2_gp041 [Cellulophaga phage phi13:2]
MTPSSLFVKKKSQNITIKNNNGCNPGEDLYHNN